MFRTMGYLGLVCAVFFTMLVTLALVGLKNSNSPVAAAPSAVPTGVSTSGSNLGSPSATTATTAAAPGGAETVDISTPNDIHYDKNELDVTAGQQVTVRYTNNSTTPHNIDILNGPNPDSPRSPPPRSAPVPTTYRRPRSPRLPRPVRTTSTATFTRNR